MPQHTRYIAGDFRVDGDAPRPGPGKHINVLFRVVHHQVDVQGQVEATVQSLHQRGAVAQVGHEMRIHDVHMDHVAPGLRHAAHIALHVQWVGRKN